ncbi:MAG: TolC family protein [Spirochaetales bacterium]|nr:TolC family protein [Spirochaetales bacterium]
MSRVKKMILISLAGFFIQTMGAQTVLSSLDEIAAYGAENSLDFKNDQVSLLKAENNRQSILLLKDTSVSATGSYGNSAQPDNSDDSLWGVDVKIDIPVIEQIGLSGSINENGEGSASIVLKPLSHSDSREQSMLSYQSALITAEAARMEAESNAVDAALSWMAASREYDTQEKQTQLTQAACRDDKVRFDLGEITFDELQDSLVSWSEARVAFTEKEKLFRTAESTLYSALGGSKESVSLQLLTIDTLEAEVDRIANELNRAAGEYLKSTQLKLAVLNKSSADAALKNTWIYEPELTASASLNFDESGYKGFSASLTFSISPDDIQVAEKEISREEYQIASLKEIQSRYEAELEFDQIIDATESAGLNREITSIGYEQARILLSEAELLLKRGDISELDYEESRLSLQESENALFRALAEEYKAWISLKAYL